MPPNTVKSGTPPERPIDRALASAAAPFNIDAVDDVAGYAIVYDRRVTVLHIDGAAYRALRRMGEDPDITPLYDAVRRSVPELTADEVDRLRPKQLAFLLGIAGAMVDLVEAEQQRQDAVRKAEDPDPNEKNAPRSTSNERPASA